MENVDIAIIGCGPAGLSAAINVKARNRSLLLIGPQLCSSSLHKAHKINNYLGLPEMPGEELRKAFLTHAKDMGVDVTQVSVAGIYPVGDVFQLQIQDDFIEAKAVVLTTGVVSTHHLPGEEAFTGKGVSYCATCDALFYRGKTIAVIAEEEEHEDEARFLAEVVEKMYFLPKYEKNGEFPANVEIIRDRVKGFRGGERLETISLAERGEVPVDGVFILKAQMPMSQLVPGLELENKHVRVNLEMATNVPGVFAAGDVAGRPYQVAKAVGQGQQAALSAVTYIDKV